MSSEIADRRPITVMAGDVQTAQRTAEALRRLLRDNPEEAITVTADGQTVKIDALLMDALQQLVSLLAQGNDVALIPVHEDIPLTEAASFLNVSQPFLIQLLESNQISSTGVGDSRHIRLADLIEYKERRRVENRRDLATALAVAQEAGAYD